MDWLLVLKIYVLVILYMTGVIAMFIKMFVKYFKFQTEKSFLKIILLCIVSLSSWLGFSCISIITHFKKG